MFRKVREAIRLLLMHLPVIAVVILIVSLPRSLVVNYLLCYVPGNAWIWVEGAIGTIFGPISGGALVHVLWQIKAERPVRGSEAIVVGFGSWGRLFAARFITVNLIVFGLFLLVVPGIILALRYALLDGPVIVEGADGVVARGRSEHLTNGVKLQILGVALMCLVGFVAAALVIGALTVAIQNRVVTSAPVFILTQTVSDWILDLVLAVLPISLFLFYWEARQRERSGSAGEAHAVAQ